MQQHHLFHNNSSSLGLGDSDSFFYESEPHYIVQGKKQGVGVQNLQDYNMIENKKSLSLTNSNKKSKTVEKHSEESKAGRHSVKAKA